MTRTEQYDYAMKHAAHWEKLAVEAESMANAIINNVVKDLGITHISRDPGFDCWGHAALSGFWPTPRAVAVALDAAGK